MGSVAWQWINGGQWSKGRKCVKIRLTEGHKGFKVYNEHSQDML